MRTPRVGDLAILTIPGIAAAYEVTVSMASANGRSLILAFENAITMPNGSAYVGAMPIFQHTDDRWLELIGSCEILLRWIS